MNKTNFNKIFIITTLITGFIATFLIFGNMYSAYAVTAEEDFGNSRIDVAINGEDLSGNNETGNTNNETGDTAVADTTVTNTTSDTSTSTVTATGSGNNRNETLANTSAQVGIFILALLVASGLFVYYNKDVRKKLMKFAGIGTPIILILMMLVTSLSTINNIKNVSAITFNGNGYPVSPGDILTYRVVISNTGKNSRDNVVAKVTLNPGMLYKVGSIRLDDGTEFSDANDGDGATFQSPNLLIFNAGTINGGSVKVYYFDAEVQSTLKVSKPKMTIEAMGFEPFEVSYNNIAYNPLKSNVKYVSTLSDMVTVNGNPLVPSGNCTVQNTGNIECNVLNLPDMTPTGKKIVATVYNSSSNIPIPVETNVSLPSGSIIYNYNMNTNEVDKITVKLKDLFELANPATIDPNTGELTGNEPNKTAYYLFMYDSDTSTLLKLGYIQDIPSETTYVYNQSDYELLDGSPVVFTDFDQIFLAVINNDGNYNPEDYNNKFLWLKDLSWQPNATQKLKFGSLDTETEITKEDFDTLVSGTVISSSSDVKRDVLEASFTGFPFLPENFGYYVEYYIEKNVDGNISSADINIGEYTSGTLTANIANISTVFDTYYKESQVGEIYTYTLRLQIGMTGAKKRVIATGSPQTRMFTKAFTWNATDMKYNTLTVPASDINTDYASSMDKVVFSIETSETFTKDNVFMEGDFTYNVTNNNPQKLLFGNIGVNSFDSGNGSYTFSNEGEVAHAKLDAELNNMPDLPNGFSYYLYAKNEDVNGTLSAENYIGTFTKQDNKFVLSVTKPFSMTKQYNKLIVLYGPDGLNYGYENKTPMNNILYQKNLYEYIN